MNYFLPCLTLQYADIRVRISCPGNTITQVKRKKSLDTLDLFATRGLNSIYILTRSLITIYSSLVATPPAHSIHKARQDIPREIAPSAGENRINHVTDLSQAENSESESKPPNTRNLHLFRSHRRNCIAGDEEDDKSPPT